MSGASTYWVRNKTDRRTSKISKIAIFAIAVSSLVIIREGTPTQQLLLRDQFGLTFRDHRTYINIKVVSFAAPRETSSAFTSALTCGRS